MQAQQELADAERPRGWSNTTDIGVSATSGNSETETLSLHSLLEWRTERAGFRLKLDGTRSNTADDRFRIVDPGFSWEPGAQPPTATTTLVDPDNEPDTEKYYAEVRFERSIAKRPLLRPGELSWHAGASWDRNRDAGIAKRLMAFAGIGNNWWHREDLKFQTSFSLSWTRREEVTPDPEKDDRFAGLRFNWLYENRWGRNVVYHNDWRFNFNLGDFSDYSSAMTNSLTVPMTRRLSLRVSLQWLYNSLPAFESIDVVAEVVIVDPDGIPGSGDELFETVESAGVKLDLGSVQERKEKLDTVFTTSLAIRF